MYNSENWAYMHIVMLVYYKLSIFSNNTVHSGETSTYRTHFNVKYLYVTELNDKT